MLRLSVATILPAIDAMAFFTRLAGLIRVASRKVNAGTADAPKWMTQRFPVACEVTAKECWESNRYLQLAPNTDQKAMGYFEEVSPMRLVREIGDGVMEWQGQVRFVNILNLKKLNINSKGATTCGIAPNVVFALMKELDGKEFAVTHSSITNATVQADFVMEEDPTNVFDRYTYRDAGINIDAIQFYPSQILSTVWDLTLRMSKGCVVDLVQGTELTC